MFERYGNETSLLSGQNALLNVSDDAFLLSDRRKNPSDDSQQFSVITHSPLNSQQRLPAFV